MQQQIFSTAPLLEIAGVPEIKVKWPSHGDTIAIALAIENDNGGTRFWAVLLSHLAGLPLPVAQRLALANTPAVAAMFAHEDHGTARQWMVRAALVAEPPSVKIATIELAGFEVGSILLANEPVEPAPEMWCSR